LDASGIRRELFAVLSDRAKLAIGLAASEPLLLLVFVAAPPQKVAAIRVGIVAAGLHGRVTVAASSIPPEQRKRAPPADLRGDQRGVGANE